MGGVGNGFILRPARVAAARLPDHRHRRAGEVGRARRALAPPRVPLAAEPIAPTSVPEPEKPAEEATAPPEREPPITASSPIAPPPQPAAAAPRMSLEERLGTQWAVWVGGLAVVLGGIFLVRYSIEQGLQIG